MNKVKYIYWHSHRNGNDGRRESAIGINQSLLHLCNDEEKTLCGRTPHLWPRVSDSIRPMGPKTICKICLRKNHA